MYLGRQQLGTWLDVYLPCVNASRTPTMPDAVPTIKITRDSDSAVVYNGLMPVVEKTGSTLGLFCARLLLGSGFSVGLHSVRLVYVRSGLAVIEDRKFEIMPAGNSAGQALSMYYFHHPSAEHVVYQLESGEILRGKNPRIN